MRPNAKDHAARECVYPHGVLQLFLFFGLSLASLEHHEQRREQPRGLPIPISACHADVQCSHGIRKASVAVIAAYLSEAYHTPHSYSAKIQTPGTSTASLDKSCRLTHH